jgi:hypothetical protein
VDKAMKTAIFNFFTNNWQRKLISLILAIIIWLVVDHSLTSSKTITGIPIRVINIPTGKTIEGIQKSGKLSKKLTLSVVGNSSALEDLTSNDLEVIIDAAGNPDEWIVNITKKNLVSLNPEIDVSKAITRVFHPSFILHMTKLVTEKIPVIITQPIGEPPRGYELLDIWPYKLHLTVSGPEEVIKDLMNKEQKLTFNLSDISKAQLDHLSSSGEDKSDVISYYIPTQWKQINIPILSDIPIQIDDPQASSLRIDFIKCSLLPINSPIQVTTYFPPQYCDRYNPLTCKIASSPYLTEKNDLLFLDMITFAKGVDRLFLQTVKNHMQIVITIDPSKENQLLWSMQFIDAKNLEDDYIERLSSETKEGTFPSVNLALKESYLRNRFRSYMNRFSLYSSNNLPLEMRPLLKGFSIEVFPSFSDPKDAK